jgi:hypothetical protein
MQFKAFPLVLLLTLVASGCGREEPPFVDNSKDPELYACNMRRVVLMLVNRARGGDPASQIGILAAELNKTDRPLGTYREIFLEMQEKVNDAAVTCRHYQTSRPPIDRQLDELAALAESLPKAPGSTSDVPTEN